jgi:predicted TIM-barrel fold metal-dependent hydrolase
MKKIDFEAHGQIKAFSNAIGDYRSEEVPGCHDYDSIRLGLMDEADCTVQILSSPGPVHLIPKEHSIDIIRQVNDNAIAACKRHPDRFLAYAMLPVDNNDAAFEELERCRDNGVVGWHAMSNYGGRSIDQDELLPLVYKIAELGMHIYLHPAPPVMKRFLGLGPVLEYAYGFHIDPSIVLLRLILKGVLDDCPDLKIILGHYGEGLPILLDRLDAMPETKRPEFEGQSRNRKPISFYFENNIWITTSGNFSKVAFDCAKARLGINHMLFASDFPAESIKHTVEFLEGMDMTDSEKRRLYYKNAKEFFGINI